MTEHIVVLPGRLEASWASVLVDCARKLAEHEDVVVDASSVEFAHPYGVVTIASALLRRERDGMPRPSYLPPASEAARAFLDEVGFGAFVRTGSAGSAGTLAIRRLPPGALQPAYAHDVAQLIEQHVPRTSESVAYLIETALKELLQNVVEHAHSTTDVVALARWYVREENVRIAIADSGIGIAESLRQNPQHAHVLQDLRLVRMAVTVEGTTGRTSGRFGGLGLKHLHQVCVQRGGSVHVTSRLVDALYSASKNREKFVHALDGTTIEVDFRPGPDTGSRTDVSPEDFF